MIALFTLAACVAPEPRPGTFVGNPSLTARIADNAIQQVSSGQFEALEVPRH